MERNTNLLKRKPKLVCVRCGAEFEGRGNKRYCSKGCKTKNMNDRQKIYQHRPEVAAKRREYARGYMMNRYRTEPAFRKRMNAFAREYQKRKRAERKAREKAGVE